MIKTEDARLISHGLGWHEFLPCSSRAYSDHELVPLAALRSLIHVIKHPYTANLLCQRQHQPILQQGKSGGTCYLSWNHTRQAIKCGYRKWKSHHLAFGRIKSDSPNVEETATGGDEIDHPSIRRPLGR